jgi:integrase
LHASRSASSTSTIGTHSQGVSLPWDLAQVRSVSDHLPAWYRAMVYLAAGCGHRQGELFGVALADVDFLGRLVHVRRQVRIRHGGRARCRRAAGRARCHCPS